jgi:prepilin-type N-terminal cleavage/methylation domain-containing protein/prepilin-type processing-associated H-X9-DG protein
MSYDRIVVSSRIKNSSYLEQRDLKMKSIIATQSCRITDSGSKRGFTLIELLVVIAIISLLVSILVPSLTKAKDLAKSVSCMANLKAIGLAHMSYVNDEKDMLPCRITASSGAWYDRDTWKTLLAPHLDIGKAEWGSPLWFALWGRRPLEDSDPSNDNDPSYLDFGVFLCPGATESMRTDLGRKHTTTYDQNGQWSDWWHSLGGNWSILHANITKFKNPADAILNYCYYGRMDNWYELMPYPNTHEVGRNILYVDGHVSVFDLENDNPVMQRPDYQYFYQY